MNMHGLHLFRSLEYILQGKLSGDITFKNKTMRDTGIWLAVIPLIVQRCGFGHLWSDVFMRYACNILA